MALKSTPEPPHKMKSRSIVAAEFAVLTIVAISAWLGMKIDIGQSATPHTIIYSDAQDCSIKVYTPKLSKYGLMGDVVRPFSSPAFYRVYRSDGTLLRSSEWALFQREFADTDTARWIHSHVVYPTYGGYEGWKIPECG